MIRKCSLGDFKRYFTQNAARLKEKYKMKAWSIHSYGDLHELHLGESRVPLIKDPEEMLIQVDAASVNPIDVLMLGGYGRTLFQVPRGFELEFPLTLGRDFSGSIIDKGHGVSDKFKIGDKVYGFVPLYKQGTFAEFVLSTKCHVLPKPKQLNHEESASLVYATMTAWSALFITGNLLFRQTNGLRVLVLGGSGGVGTSAIQLLKSQGCCVFTSCSKDAIPLVTSLGADVAFDRCDPDFQKHVQLEGKYHIILDAANVGLSNIPSSWDYETYITLNSPLLRNSDKYGLVGGLLYSARNLFEANITRLPSGKMVKWGFFVPSSSGFQFIDRLICEEKIKPVIGQKFKFEDLPSAVRRVKEGHLRGKVVISYI